MVTQLTPHDWCDLLYTDTTGWLSIFTSNGNGNEVLWADSADNAAGMLALIADRDVWLGCATRAENLGSRRGGASDCVEVPGVWLDIDVFGPHHVEQDLPPTDQDAVNLIAEFPLRPTIVLHTGGGLQAWWLFPEPLPVADVKAFMPGWAATWKDLGRKHGWHVDSVFDIARVMRVPGTFNHKSDPPIPVRTLLCKPERRYGLDDLDGYTIAPPEPVRAPRAAREATGEQAGHRYNARTDPGDLLEAQGCVLDHVTAGGERHYCAPHRAHEGRVGIVVYPPTNGDDGHTTIYSETFARERGLEKDRPYDAFGLFTYLSHGGIFSAARQALEPSPPYCDVDDIPGDYPVVEWASNPDPLDKPAPKLAKPTTTVTVAEDGIPHERRLKLRDFNDIAVRRVRWLWNLKIPTGSLTLLAGREGEGKSTIAIDAMARVTLGTSRGEFEGTPRDVIIVATEDSLEHTIKPRLLAAGADMGRVFRCDMLDSGDSLSLPVDIADLEAECAEHDVALIVLDPLLSRLDGRLDSHKDGDVRRALEPLGAFADRVGCSILGLIHLNKGGSTDPLQAIMASKAFTAFARAVLFAMVDPNDPAKRLLGLAKSNLGPKDIPTLTYTFDPVEVGYDDGPIVATRIEWGPDSDFNIQDAIQQASVEPGALTEAMEWLRDYMDFEGGSCVASAAIIAGKKEQHNDRTIRRAREKLGITAERTRTAPPTVVWKWPTP